LEELELEELDLLKEEIHLVSIKAVLVLVVAMAFILGGGVQILASAKDRLGFEVEQARTSLNERGES